MNIRDLLKQYKWDDHLKDEAMYIEITYINRGAPNDISRIEYESILDIKKKFIVLNIKEEQTYIPIHRISQILNRKTGEILYIKNDSSES